MSSANRDHFQAISSLEVEATDLVSRHKYREAVAKYADIFRQHGDYYHLKAEEFIAKFPTDHDGGRWIAPEGLFDDCDTSQDIFIKMYDQAIWGGGSGGGSAINNSAQYAALLQNFVRQNKVRTIYDIGYGDWQFSRYIDFGLVKYMGLDIVPSVIENNNKNFLSESANFLVGNISDSDIPRCDLILFKGVLQHMNDEAALRACETTRKAKYAIITNDFARINVPSRDGDTRPINLTAHPFNLNAHSLYCFQGKLTSLVC